MKYNLQKNVIFVFFCMMGFLSYSQPSFKLGVENISASLHKKIFPAHSTKSYTIGLITNQTGTDQQGNRTIDILKNNNFIVRSIFAPEHGVSGIAAERDVHDTIDQKTGIPIISLYGNGSGKMIKPEHMNAIDALFFDIQDSGMRHYTYISTLLHALKLASEYNKQFIILDRPNPLGSCMEGPLVEPALISFISIAPIPLRHGMTVAELGLYFNKYILEKPAQLFIVKMSDYDRKKGFNAPFLHQLSPNLQSLQSCYGYSFLGLLGEIKPFDVGVGTPLAFQCILLPEKRNISPQAWQRLQKILDSFGIKSTFYKKIDIKPSKNKYGLQLEFNEISNLRAFDLLLAIIKFFKKEGISLTFSPAFNKAVGTKEVQELLAGTLPEKNFYTRREYDLQKFYSQAQSLFLYRPFPHINNK